jgi:hypothetical protein
MNLTTMNQPMDQTKAGRTAGRDRMAIEPTTLGRAELERVSGGTAPPPVIVNPPDGTGSVGFCGTGVHPGPHNLG